MKNILFSDSCKANCWGGGEKWVITMATELQAKGYKSTLICRPGSILEQNAKNANLSTFRAHFRNSLDFITVNKILKIIQRQKIDLIICSTNLDIKLAGMAGKIAHIPVISRQGLALIPNNLKYRFLIHNFTSSVITNTQTIKKQYESYGWFPSNFIKVIYNGIKCIGSDILPQRQDNELSNNPESKLILSAGRLNPQKGFSYLIEAARIAQETNKPWQFVILGDGEGKQQLTRLIAKYQLNNIQLKGFHKNIQDYYACADLFVLSSLAEGTPNVVLEAMAAGCPVIATDVNGVREVIEDQVNGWIIPSKDGHAIFQAIQNCIDQPELLKNITTRAYQTIQCKFTIEESVHQFIEYITNIISKYEEDHHKNA